MLFLNYPSGRDTRAADLWYYIREVLAGKPVGDPPPLKDFRPFYCSARKEFK